MERNRILRLRVVKRFPQWSCLGPLFWTLVPDHILKSLSPPKKFIAFADNFLFLESATSRRQLEYKVKVTLREFELLCRNVGLEVSSDKTEAILFGKARSLARKTIFKIGTRSVRLGATIKYLVLTIEENLSWTLTLRT